MALKPCRECRKEISSDATVCPACGKKKPHGASALVKIGGVFVGGFVLMMTCAGMLASRNPQGGAISPMTPRTAAPVAASPPPIEVTAKKLWADYHANEVAADNIYRDKRLLVSGSLSSIDKDITDDVVLSLNTPNEFMTVHASLADSQAAKAASLSKGNRVALECTGRGLVMGSPMLGECTLQEGRP